MASRKQRSVAGGELRDVFAGARDDPTAGLAGALIGATDAAGAVTGLGERGVAAARTGSAELVSRIGPAAEAVQSSVSNLRDNPPDWDQVRSTVGKTVSSTLADTADALRSTADTARTTAVDLATGPVGQAVRERATELAVTGRDLAQEKGAVARKAAEQRGREAAKKINNSANMSAAASTVAKVRKDLEPRLSELADDLGHRASDIAAAASAAALAKLHEKERRQKSRRRRRRVLVLLLGAAAGAAAAAQLRRKADAANGSATSMFGGTGPGTAAGAPIDPVSDAAAAQTSTPGADDLPPATSADVNGELKN
jgi:uncharacterized protein YidB (DUF937 family)